MANATRIVQVTSWLSHAGGGIPPVVRALTAEFRRAGADCAIAGLADPGGASPDFPADWPVLSGHIAGPAALGFSPDLARQLRPWVQKDSVVHVHGLWMHPGWLARKLADAARAVRIVSPHGMLEPWALQNSRWKKRLAAWMFEDKNLHTADCLHALCATEAQNLRRYGLKNPICILPNGIDLPAPAESLKSESPAFDSFARGKKVMLYLGRIHPKKGLVPLLHAWKAALPHPSENSWALAIAGWDQGGHEKELRKLSRECGTENSVCFLGPQFGRDKAACYRHCDAFVLPSFSEGLPMVVLEAWSYGKPVLMTPECNLPEGFSARAALRVETRIENIAEGLRQLFAMTDDERGAMGERGLRLVQDRFAWSRIAREMREVYAWLAKTGPEPGCLFRGSVA